MKRKLTVPSVSHLYTGSPHTSMPYATRFEAPRISGLFFIRKAGTGGFPGQFRHGYRAWHSMGSAVPIDIRFIGLERL